MDVVIDRIQYGKHTIAAATELTAPDRVYMTFEAIADLLGWQADRVRAILAVVPDDLRSLLDRAKAAGKSTGNTVVKAQVKKAPQGYPEAAPVVPFDVFVVLVQWETGNGNPEALDLLVSGFADSFYSLAREQLTGQALTLGDRLSYLKSWQEVLATVRGMTAEELEATIRDRKLYPDEDDYKRIEYVRLLASGQAPDPLRAFFASGFGAALLDSKSNPPLMTPERRANLREMAAYVAMANDN